MEQYSVDLNCDLGESFGAYTLGRDEQVIPFISSANIACGYHASDPMVMHKTINLSKKYGVAVGAHPGFPDLLGFGRRNMNVEPKEAKAYITYQLGALYGFAKSSGMKIQHVKPHGAMYNMAGKDDQLARAICEAIYEFDSEIILLGLANSQLTKAADAVGIRFANEFFADRAYEDDGSLVARTKQGCMITDENTAISRVVKVIKEHQVTSINGKTITLKINSICVHGDGEKALQFVKRIREKLQEEQIQVKPLHVIC